MTMSVAGDQPKTKRNKTKTQIPVKKQQNTSNALFWSLIISIVMNLQFTLIRFLSRWLSSSILCFQFYCLEHFSFYFPFLTALGANSDGRFFFNMLQPPSAITGARPQVRSYTVLLLKQKFHLLVRKLNSCRLTSANTCPERIQHAAIVKRNTQPGGCTRTVRT